jgi:para-aminobenzoate synthetase
MPVASQPQTPLLAASERLLVRKLDFLPDPESAFVHIYGESANAFWLDSSAGGERGRFSFMGDSEGPLGAVLTYDVDEGRVRVERRGEVELHDESIFDYLIRQQRLGHDTAGRGQRRGRDAAGPLRGDGAIVDLPFDFHCGFAGYLGYELKAECDGSQAHRAETPDAAFVQADRLIAFDHQAQQTYLLALVPQELANPDPTPAELHQILGLAGREFDAVQGGRRWIEEMEQRLGGLPGLGEPAVAPGPVEMRLRRAPQRYRDDIAACKDYLAAGHSYEICLTNTFAGEVDAEPLELYRALRRANPAPFAAYLRFGDLAVLSSSPERFLSVDRERRMEARPIKGTSRRSADPAEDARLAAALATDPKSRAENVTIVDLMRNDLGRVCEVGSVEVPELVRVETYETVHQLVSSVRGRLREGVGAAECVRACFPPGSMTGAPKVRTMEIIDELEGAPRGIYSGAIGWFGLGGACDLSVAIRTIVLDGGTATVGAGGAIVVESDPEQELAEMLLKARAPIAALGPGASISFDSAAAPDKPACRAPSPTPTS